MSLTASRQHKKGTITSATFDADTLANSLITVVFAAYPSATTINSVTDDKGNTYVRRITAPGPNTTLSELWDCVAPIAGVRTISFDMSAGVAVVSFINESSGAAGWTPGDTDSADSHPSSTTTPATPALTIATDSIVVCGLSEYNGGNTITAGSGFAITDKQESGGIAGAMEAGDFASNTTPGFSLSGADVCITISAAYAATTDTTPPTVTSITTAADGSTVTLQMSEDVSPSSGITGFSLWQDNSSVSIASATRSGTDRIVLTPTVALSPATTLEYAYSGGNVVDTASNALATITRRAFTNFVADPAATVTYLGFTLYFNKPWSASGTYAADGTPYRVRSASETYCVAMTPTPTGTGSSARHSLKKNPDLRRNGLFTAAWQDGRMNSNTFDQSYRDEDQFPILIEDGDTLVFTESIILPTATNITAATNASPIVVTSTSHGLTTGDEVKIVSVGGNTAANGYKFVTVVNANSFSIDGSTGNGAYTSGGTVQKLYHFVAANDPEGTVPSTRYIDPTWIDPDAVADTHTTQRSAGILNFPASAPTGEAFRPPFMGSTKPTFLTSSVNFGILAQDATALGLSVPDLERLFKRPQFGIALEHYANEFAVAHSDIPQYGRDWMYAVQEAAFVLTSDASNATKRAIYLAIIQMGIDLYHAALIEPTINSASGGFKDGRLFPILLAKLALGRTWDVSGFTFSEKQLVYDGDVQVPAETLYTGWQSSGNPKAKNVLRALGNLNHYEGKPFSDWSSIGTLGNNPWNRPEGYERLVSYSLVGLLMAALRVGGMRTSYDYEPLFWYMDRWMLEVENGVTAGRPDTLMAAAAVTYGWNAIDTEGDWEATATYTPKQGATISDKAQIVYAFVGDPLPATMVSATVDVNGETLELFFSKAVTGVAASDFTISGGHTLSGADGTGDTWTMAVSGTVFLDEVLTLDYNGTAIVDADDETLETFSDFDVDNTSTQVLSVTPSPSTLERGQAGQSVSLTGSHTNFDVNTTVTISAGSISFDVISHTIINAVIHAPDVIGDVTLTITQEGPHHVFGPTLTVEDTIDPTLLNARITTQSLVLRFDEPVDGSESGITLSGVSVSLGAPTGGGTNTLSFPYTGTVSPSDVITLDYAPGDIADPSANPLGAISDFTVRNVTAPSSSQGTLRLGLAISL